MPFVVLEQDSIAASVAVILLVILALVFRMMRVAISLAHNRKEKYMGERI